jgi:hypothetical protein
MPHAAVQFQAVVIAVLGDLAIAALAGSASAAWGSATIRPTVLSPTRSISQLRSWADPLLAIQPPLQLVPSLRQDSG